MARRGATGVNSDEAAVPEDEHSILKEELVVATALGKRNIAKPVPWTAQKGCYGRDRDQEPGG